MGLDFYWLDDRKKEELLLTLDEGLLAVSQDAFTRLWEETGIYVDPYSDTRISSTHAKIIFETLNLSGDSKHNALCKFRKILKEASENEKTIFAVGD